MAHLTLSLFSLAVLTSFSIGALADSENIKTRVKDLRYGVALWHYFQDEHREALTELMVAEYQSGIQGHNHNPSLMIAGLNMAYGMAISAENRLRILLVEEENPLDEQSTRAAWYYLAEIAYQQGDLESTQTYLDEISSLSGVNEKRSIALETRVNDLRVNLALAQQQTDLAERLLAEQGLSQPALAWFNLGNAHARKIDLGLSSQAYDRALTELGKQEVIFERDLVLRDKIHTAAGYVALLRDQPLEAQSYFGQVQNNSLSSDLALMGYARAAADTERFTESLGYYQALISISRVSNESIKARLAIPANYERMGQYSQALSGYSEAILEYEKHQQFLADLIAQLKDGEVQTSFESVKNDSLPAYTYLSSLYSASHFQARLTELDELRDLAQLHSELSFRLGLLNDSLNLRNLRRESHKTTYADLAVSQTQDRIQNQLESKRSEFELAILDRDYLAFEDPQSLGLLKRIQVSEQRINKLEKQGEDVLEASRMLKRYNGLLLWDAAQDYAANRHEAEKALVDGEKQFAQLRNRNQQLESIFDQLPQLRGHSRQIAQLEDQSSQTQRALEQSIAMLEQSITSTLVAELQSELEMLGDYLVEAKLARLRLYEENSFYALGMNSTEEHVGNEQ